MSKLPERFERRFILRLTGGLVGGGLVGTALTGVGAAQTAEWTESYGYRNQPSEALDAVRTDDGGYVAAGRVFYEVTEMYPWLFALDGDGRLKWARMYGDGADGARRWGEARALAELPDGYAFVADDADDTSGFWVVATDHDGAVRRSRFVELPSAVAVRGVDLVAVDGGVVVLAAATRDSEPRVRRAQLVRLDADLEPRWRRTYGGAESLTPAALVRPADGGYAIAATAGPRDGRNDASYRLLRVDDCGECCWARTYDGGGADDEVAGLAERRRDGETRGYALIGDSDDAVRVVATGRDGSLRSARAFYPPRTGELLVRAADIESVDGGYALFADTVEQYWLAETDRELDPRRTAVYDSGNPWFDEHIASTLVTSGGEYGLFGTLYDGGDADTARALVVEVADDG